MIKEVEEEGVLVIYICVSLYNFRGHWESDCVPGLCPGILYLRAAPPWGCAIAAAPAFFFLPSPATVVICTGPCTWYPRVTGNRRQ